MTEMKEGNQEIRKVKEEMENSGGVHAEKPGANPGG